MVTEELELKVREIVKAHYEAMRKELEEIVDVETIDLVIQVDSTNKESHKDFRVVMA